MRRRGFSIWGLIGVLALVAIAVLILYPVFDRAKWISKKASCQTNLKQVALGVFQYLQDYDEKYPVVNVHDTSINEHHPLGWADAQFPYLKTHQLFWCMERLRTGERDGKERKPSDRDYSDYFYNRRLAGIEQKKVTDLASTIMLGDGNDGTDAANARYSLSTLPAAWRKDKTSPSYRHLDGANYAFADGHVKWLKPEKVTDKKPVGSTLTFAIN